MMVKRGRWENKSNIERGKKTKAGAKRETERERETSAVRKRGRDTCRTKI